MRRALCSSSILMRCSVFFSISSFVTDDRLPLLYVLPEIGSEAHPQSEWPTTQPAGGLGGVFESDGCRQVADPPLAEANHAFSCGTGWACRFRTTRRNRRITANKGFSEMDLRPSQASLPMHGDVRRMQAVVFAQVPETSLPARPVRHRIGVQRTVQPGRSGCQGAISRSTAT